MNSRARANSQGKRSGISERSDSVKSQWSNQTYLLDEIVEQFSFPLLLRCNPQTLFTKKSYPLPLNIGKPILIYEKRTIRKLLARNVLFDTNTRRFGETDETVVIPSDYEGNFLKLNSRTARDENIHDGITSVAKSNAPAFINLNQLTAFMIRKTLDSNDYPKIQFSPGNVFIIDGAFKGTSKQRIDNLDLNAEVSVQELQFLKCRDERNANVLIPLNHPGKFIEILANPNEEKKLSMQSSEIISTQKFPQLLRYVYGGTKPRLTAYSGLFTALDSFEETSLVGCVVESTGFTFTELPVSSPLTFQIFLIRNNLLQVPILKQALKLCEQRSRKFSQDMKFKFKFALRILEDSAKAKSVYDEDDPPSATNSARFGITNSYLYL